MTETARDIEEIRTTVDWNRRVQLIRGLSESLGRQRLPEVYSEIARLVYAPQLAPDFAYVHWTDDYELRTVESAYELAVEATTGFSKVDLATLARALRVAPSTLRIFRLLLGWTVQEFAAASDLVGDGARVGTPSIKRMEAGKSVPEKVAGVCAQLIDEAMSGRLFTSVTPMLRPKIAKPDTANGWISVQKWASEGVPLAMFLHQRHYGGAFRQLLDATSSRRGDHLEDEVSRELVDGEISHIRTGTGSQAPIAARFGINVRPAPDFVVFDASDYPRALIECKVTNDGGTARDKASRFSVLRAEGQRLGGVPVFAVLAGLGWRRTTDALGPVIRDTDGRVFTPATLKEITSVFPLAALRRGGRDR